MLFRSKPSPIKKGKKAPKGQIRVERISKKDVIDPVQLEKLLNNGQERGFITTSEILYAFPRIEMDIEGLEKVYDDFKERGVAVKEVTEFLETKAKKEKKGRKALVGKIDPIQMYLKEIGKSGFLSAKEEKELAKRAKDTIDILKSRNAQLLKGKKVPSTEFKRALYEGIQELTYDPKGFDVDARYGLARDLTDVVERDLRKKGGYALGQPIDAADIELAKQSLDAHMKGPSFEKKLLDLGIDKQGMMKFRTKLDDLLDSDKVGGIEYKNNNDLMSDLITVSDVMKRKESGSYVDAAGRSINTQNWWETHDVNWACL